MYRPELERLPACVQRKRESRWSDQAEEEKEGGGDRDHIWLPSICALFSSFQPHLSHPKSTHFQAINTHKHTQNPASLLTLISSDPQTNLSPLTVSLSISQSFWGICEILRYNYNAFANYLPLSAFSLSSCHIKNPFLLFPCFLPPLLNPFQPKGISCHAMR